MNMQIALIEDKLESFQISLSTADLERYYFAGDYSPSEGDIESNSVLPDGVYRIIDGELCRIVPGRPNF